MKTRRVLWICAALLLLLQLGYMLLWWNLGLQLNSNGLGQLAGLAILSGKVPYLDFHFWCPPGHLFVYSAIIGMFGDGVIYIRAFALVERMAIFVLLYFWLARVFTARAAFFGTLVAGVGFSSDVADGIAHYGFDAMLASVAAGFAASVAMTSNWRWSRAFYFVAGVCVGCCMLAKQTQGVGLFPVLLVVFAFGDKTRALRYRALRVVEYVAGWCLPTGLVAWWLVRAGAWHAFVNQSFLEGTSSKGPLGSILLRPLFLPFTIRPMGLALGIAIILICVYAYLGRRDGGSAGVSESRVPWLLFAGCLAALFVGCGVAWWMPHPETRWNLQRALMEFSMVCIFLSLFGSAALALRLTWGGVRGRLDSRELQIWILAAVSAAAAYMFSLSWAAFEQMLIPGFAFVLALALDSPMCRRFRWREFVIIGCGLFLVSGAAVRKMAWPYNWENWVDGPIRTETVAAPFPELRGIRMTKESAAFLEKVVGTIDAHSKPDETIFCFPNYALFYVLAHREPGVFAYMHWFDIVSDRLVREDEVRIREHPPAVILSVEMPEAMMSRMEDKFRNGAPSGQREMLALIKTLPGYRLVESVTIPYQDYPLNIYARD